MTNDERVFEVSRPPAVERLARIEGQSNFLALLDGIEAGPDTTQDMAALAFARTRGCVPEALEAYVAQTSLFKLPLMSMLFAAVVDEFAPKVKDYPWIRGAIADAFLLVRSGAYRGPPDLSAIDKARRNRYRRMAACCAKPAGQRAKSFHVQKQTYLAMRNLAEGVFWRFVWRAQDDWYRSRGREPDGGGNSYTQSEDGRNFGGHRKPKFPACDEPFDENGEVCFGGYCPPGVPDRLGWDDRNADPGPTITLAQPRAIDPGNGEAQP